MGQWSMGPVDDVIEVDAANELHGDVRGASATTKIKNGDQVGVAQFHSQFGLVEKLLHDGFIVRETREDSLERHQSRNPARVGANPWLNRLLPQTATVPFSRNARL